MQGSSKIVMVGHINRFTYPYSMIRKALNNDELGDIVAIHCKRNFSRSWFESFGKRTHPVYESGIHEIDLLLYYIQEKCEKVYAVENYVTKKPFPDTFSAILTFVNGVNCTINSNWCVPNSSPKNLNKGALDLIGTIDATLELVGTKGIVKYDLLNNGLTFWTDSDVQNPDYTLWPWENSLVGGAIRAELQEFISSVKKGKESELMPLSHSLESLRIAEAIVHSANTGQTVTL